MPEIQYLGTGFFALAVLHTFSVKKFADWSHRFPPDSLRGSFLHLISEVEVVFGLWAALFLAMFAAIDGPHQVLEYQESLEFTEPIFIFGIMVISATKPVVWLAREIVRFSSHALSKVIRVPQIHSDVFVTLTFGPLLGSFITEAAAMTVTAMLLSQILRQASPRVLYAVLAVLFVNVSVGGALTHFAAPPILMVAGKWGWDFSYVFYHFGLKSIAGVIINSLLLVIVFSADLRKGCITLKDGSAKRDHMPVGILVLHCFFLFAMVASSHYPNAAMGIFLLFLGVTTVTKKYQDRLRLRESLLVAFFLGGIIVFGQFQRWWLEPLLHSMADSTLFWGATALTAVTDNAALTFLGSQVESLSELAKIFLVSGALAGGGLTIIANAPNAAGYGILQDKFEGGVSPLWLFVAAIVPTLVVVLCFRLLPF